MYDIFYIGNFDNSWHEIKKKYPHAQILSIETNINEIQKKSFTKHFWVVFDDLILTDFNLNDYRVTEWDDSYVHVFKNGNFNDGVCLIGKYHNISQREFSNRFFSNKKDIDVLASTPKPYNFYQISTYEDFISACESATTAMFYAVWHDIQINQFNFDFQIAKWNQSITHVFQNGNYFDGICLFPKNNNISKKEFDYRFFTVKKEIAITASQPKQFDIVFISYFEILADQNYENLQKKLNRPIIRIDGIKGIHNAHKKAAQSVSTSMFWVVDADATILENFSFNYQVPKYEQDIVHVWKSINPVNGLEYGNGGVKLLPTKATAEMQDNSIDMTTSISGKFKLVPEISNIASFNTDPFNSWKSAFRECVKLSSKSIKGQVDQETEYRLLIWTTKTSDKFALDGAVYGRSYGDENKTNLDALKKINDFDWLKQTFDERFRQN